MKRLYLIFILFTTLLTLKSQNSQIQIENYLELVNNFYADTQLDSSIKYSQLLIDISNLNEPASLSIEQIFRSYFILARSWSLKSNYQISNEVWENYYNYRKKNSPTDTDELIGIRCQIASNNFHWRKVEGMKDELDKINQYEEKEGVKSNHIKAYIKYLEGQYAYFTGELDAGTNHILNSIDLFRKSKDTSSTLMIRCISEASNMYASQGNSRMALNMSLYAQSKSAERFGRESYQAGKYSNNIGLDYYSLQEYEKAEFYFEDYIATIKRHRGPKDNALAPAYVNLGLLNDRSNPNRSIHYFHAAERLYINKFGPDNHKLTVAYYNLANQYIFIGNLKEAIKYANLLEDLALKQSGPEKEFLIISKTLKGIIYSSDNNLKEAIATYLEVAKYYVKNPPNDPMREIENLNELARSYLKTEHLMEAEAISLKTLNLLKKLPNQHKIMESNVLGNLAIIASKNNNYADALLLSNQSLELLNGNLNDLNSSNVLKPALFIESLGDRINMETAVYISSGKKKNEALLKFQSITKEAISDLINRTEDNEDNYLLRNEVRYTTESLLNSLSITPVVNRTPYYFDDILTLFETNKNLSLLSEINLDDLTKVNFADQTILDKENYFRANIKELRLEIEHLINESENLKILEDSLFYLIERQQIFLEKLKLEFPTYYEMVYGMDIPSVAKIQSDLLAPDDLLIQYFLSDTTLFVLGIEKDIAHFHKIGLNDDFTELINGYLDQLRSPGSGLADLTLQSCELYNILLKYFLEKNKTLSRILIINDGLLNYLPFEVLSSSCDIENPNYLVEDYAISYHLSSSLAHKHALKPNKGTVNFSGFAADYEQSLIPEENAVVMRSVGPVQYQLPGAIEEIKNLHSLVGGNIYLKNEATETNFKKNASSMDIIHLSLHGRVSDYFPMESGLLFHPEDSSNNGILTTNEIYLLNLNAKMAILSACETGVGAYKKGEGIQSISRAFTYAGAQSILYSLWKVPDNSTKDIMVEFYQNLKDGFKKDEALKKSKLNYLQNTIEPEQRHPYYWAGFVLQGNYSNIDFQANFPFPYILIGIFVIGLIGYLLIKKKRVNS